MSAAIKMLKGSVASFPSLLLNTCETVKLSPPNRVRLRERPPGLCWWAGGSVQAGPASQHHQPDWSLREQRWVSDTYWPPWILNESSVVLVLKQKKAPRKKILLNDNYNYYYFKLHLLRKKNLIPKWSRTFTCLKNFSCLFSTTVLSPPDHPSDNLLPPIDEWLWCTSVEDVSATTLYHNAFIFSFWTGATASKVQQIWFLEQISFRSKQSLPLESSLIRTWKEPDRVQPKQHRPNRGCQCAAAVSYYMTH